MKEIILNIHTNGNFKIDENSYQEYEGFIIETNKQKIYIGIENGQSCCEDFGSLSSEDNIQDFIDCELLNIKVVDTALKTYDVDLTDTYDGEVMFINLETSNGVLQFVLYNFHNGYYGHTAFIKSEQITEFNEL